MESNYEQKYKAALEVARANYDTAIQMDKDTRFAKDVIINTLENIFPELETSEDEKIRRRIYSYINATLDDYAPEKEKWLAWLEKQGETEITEEQKFNVGDWVVRTDGSEFYDGSKTVQITNIEEEKYWLSSGTWVEVNEIRHWTIADAQAGDVLVADDLTVLVSRSFGDNSMITYLQFDPIDEVFDLGSHLYYANVYPATTKQCDFLFKKMEEAGYEWNEYTKELKKIK